MPIANILWNATENLTAMFEKVAEGLTLQMRDMSSDAASRQLGTAVRYVLHIRVRWGFFSLLVVTVVCGFVYVVGVLVQTRQLGLPTWKGSPYPTLAFAPDGAETRDLLQKDCCSGREGSPLKGVLRSRGSVVMGLQDVGNGYYRLRAGGDLGAQ
ncbi:hypothetical protein B0T25DRAFT_264188 [Lasiosphaeria hispida]|uniref:Uncharacterized protein n=1 Tax=Lasiosphaeria hispida TaxID=260671 RepID=A0AAJ0MA13_9PEZI|nr:hypothetical protein B0T25DRAFT_264188 [Lasiosphaeria hispida]